MELVQKIEHAAGDWFKQAPHLPPHVVKWIAANIWWIVIIGVVLTAGSALTILPLLFGASLIAPLLSAAYGYGLMTGLSLLNAWISLGFLIAIAIIEANAVMSLKTGAKRGWDLLFLSLLLSIVSSLVSAILLASVSGLMGAVLTALIGGYVLFEIRGRFAVRK